MNTNTRFRTEVERLIAEHERVEKALRKEIEETEAIANAYAEENAELRRKLNDNKISRVGQMIRNYFK